MRVTQSTAAGDLTVQVDADGGDDIGRLGAALSSMINDLKGIIGQVVESANHGEGSRCMAGATYLSESSQNQAATMRRCRRRSRA